MHSRDLSTTDVQHRDVQVAPGVRPAITVRYIDPDPETGKFEVVYKDGTQVIGDTGEQIAKAQIITHLTECCSTYGHIPPTARAIGTMAKIVYDTLPQLRFLDIECAFRMQAIGRIKVDLTTYQQPIRVEQVIKLLQAYWDIRNNILKHYRTQWRKDNQKAAKDTVSAPESFKRQTAKLAAKMAKLTPTLDRKGFEQRRQAMRDAAYKSLDIEDIEVEK